MKLEDSINNSIDLENRSPQSTKLFTKIAILISTLALLIYFICIITYQVDNLLGLHVFSATFIPMVILFVLALFLAVSERLREKYLGAQIAIMISVALFLCLAAFVIFELVKYENFYVAPFNTPPPLH